MPRALPKRRQLGEKALDAARRAVTADPNNSQTHLSLAIVYGRIALDEPPRRKIEMSRLIKQEAETAARLDPKNDYAWHVLGRWNYEVANFNPGPEGSCPGHLREASRCIERKGR